MRKACLLLLCLCLAFSAIRCYAAETAKEPLSAQALIAKLAEGRNERERNTTVDQLVKLGASAVPDLKEALKDKNWRVQWGSAIALGMIGDKSSGPPLIEVLRNGSDPGKRGAATALGLLKDTSAVRYLLEAMYGVNGMAAVEALGLIGDTGVSPMLIRFMEDSTDNDEKRVAAEALGRLKDPSAIPVLIDGIKSSSWQVQGPAKWALTSIGKPAAPALIEALKIEKGDAGRLAAEALGEMKEPTAVQPLVTALKTSKSVPTRVAAAASLGAIKDPAAIAPLIEAFEDKGEYTVEFVWKGVRNTSSDALSEFGEGALPALHETLKTAKGERLELTCSPILKIKSKTSIRPLIDVMLGFADADAEKIPLVKTLGQMGDKLAAPTIIELMKSKEVKIRLEAAAALGNIADESALPMLQSAALTDPDGKVKALSQRAADRIKFLNLK